MDLARQLLPGTFEHALNHLLDHEIDLTHFDARFCNDGRGPRRIRPRCCSRWCCSRTRRGSSAAAHRAGVPRARDVHRLCGDRGPHFTTIAKFVSTLGEDIAPVFAAVLAICDRQGLIGREMFAIDGVKLPSNAAKSRSGTRADFERQAKKLEAAAATMLQRHREADAKPSSRTWLTKDSQAHRAAATRRGADPRLAGPASRGAAWGRKGRSARATAPTMRAPRWRPAKASSRANRRSGGRWQASDHRGSPGPRHRLRAGVAAARGDAMKEMLRRSIAVITADAGYHSEANLQSSPQCKVEALIADNDMRRRDERFATQAGTRKRPIRCTTKTSHREEGHDLQPSDFTYDAEATDLHLPGRQVVVRRGGGMSSKGSSVVRFEGAQRDCLPCSHRAQCLRTPEKTRRARSPSSRGRPQPRPETHTERMKRASIRPWAAPDTASASPPWSLSSLISGTTRGSIASRCAAGRKSMGSGNSSAWSTTSRNSPITVTRSSGKSAAGSPVPQLRPLSVAVRAERCDNP